MIGVGLCIPQIAARRTGNAVPVAAGRFFASATQHWGDRTPVFGKVS